MSIRCCAALLLAVCFAPCGAAAPANEYSQEIAVKTQDLKDLQKALKEKRVEKERCLLEEKCIRRELNRIERDLAALQRKNESLRREIRKAKAKLGQAEKELRLAGWEKQQWATALHHETTAWHHQQLSHQRLYDDPLTSKFRLQALRQSKEYFVDAQRKEHTSQAALALWKSAQARLLDLKAQQDKTARDQAAARKQKQELLKSTVGRRVVAEDDIVKITETAQALQQLIIKLEREKKKTEAEAAADKKRVRGQKKTLPWPVAGEIVAQYGKSKHPELDTYVISNGIKIRAAAAANVAAIDAGEVIFAGEFRSYGLMVIVDHGGGFYSIYGQLGETAVEEDQKVKAGESVGKLPAEAKPVLYFEVRVDGQPENPLNWLR